MLVYFARYIPCTIASAHFARPQMSCQIEYNELLRKQPVLFYKAISLKTIHDINQP